MSRKEFALTSGGHAQTIYSFSATQFREEPATPPAANA
jgi:hypothetical protein